MRIKILLLSCGFILVLAGCNGTQTTSGNDTLQTQLNETRSQLARLRAEVTDMQSEMRIINGHLDELAFGVQRSGSSGELDAYTNRVVSMDSRLDNIETYLANAVEVKQGQSPFQPAGGQTTYLATTVIEPAVVAAAGTDAAVATAGAVTTDAGTTISIGAPDLPEDEFYAKAKATFDAGSYAESRLMFEDFLKFYPNSKIADSAAFWVGETYYREENYERAILEYQNLLDNYPNGNKVSAALYKQGLAFIALGDNNNGKILLEDLVRRYPDSQEARVAANRLKNL